MVLKSVYSEHFSAPIFVPTSSAGSDPGRPSAPGQIRVLVVPGIAVLQLAELSMMKSTLGMPPAADGLEYTSMSSAATCVTTASVIDTAAPSRQRILEQRERVLFVMASLTGRLLRVLPLPCGR